MLFNRNRLGVSDWLIDLDRLDASASDWQSKYSSADPFPHLVIDDFLSQKYLRAIVSNFDSKPGQRWRQIDATMDRGHPASRGKRDSADLRAMRPIVRQLIWELTSKPFILFLQKVSSIPRLISDPMCHGGGLHETLAGGFLKVHADFQKHPIYQLDRRINLILYLNEDWHDSYGGHLELWGKDMASCAKRIAPVAGRCVIFNTDKQSFHGHPHPLTCPIDRTRRSLALYYYSNGRDDGARSVRATTHWQVTPEKF